MSSPASLGMGGSGAYGESKSTTRGPFFRQQKDIVKQATRPGGAFLDAAGNFRGREPGMERTVAPQNQDTLTAYQQVRDLGSQVTPYLQRGLDLVDELITGGGEGTDALAEIVRRNTADAWRQGVAPSMRSSAMMAGGGSGGSAYDQQFGSASQLLARELADAETKVRFGQRALGLGALPQMVAAQYVPTQSLMGVGDARQKYAQRVADVELENNLNKYVMQRDSATQLINLINAAAYGNSNTSGSSWQAGGNMSARIG